MKANITSVFGQYRWTASANVDEKLIPLLVNFGLLQIAQRSPSTAAEKEIATKGELWGKGIDKRPKGFQRNLIPFTKESADTLKKHLSQLRMEVSRDEKDNPIYATIPAEVTVEQYFGAEAAEIKFAKERAKYVLRCSEGKGSKLAEAVGYDGPIGDGTKEGAPIEFLQAIKVWVDAQAARL